MKRFVFSLQKLLDYKKQVFGIEQAVLADMRSVLRDLEQALQDLHAEHRERSEQFNGKMARGLSIPEIQRHKAYMRVVDESIAQKTLQISFQKLAIDKQADKVREAKQEISTMEKLREKKYEEYLYHQNKAQEQFIEEFVSHARAAATQGREAG